MSDRRGVIGAELGRCKTQVLIAMRGDESVNGVDGGLRSLGV